MSRGIRLLVLGSIALVIGSCSDAPNPSGASLEDVLDAESLRRVRETDALRLLDDETLVALAAGEPLGLLVELHDYDVDDLSALGYETSADGLNADDISLRRSAFEARVAVFAIDKEDLRATLPSSIIEYEDYDQLPMLFLELSSIDDLLWLGNDQLVTTVYSNEAHSLLVAGNLSLINQPQAASDGHTGVGSTVAVLDTGVDYTNPAFGSCSAAGEEGCSVVYSGEFGDIDGQLDDNGHGTNVAGIVLSVAPAADIAALDVFDGASAYSSDIISAINWCISHQEEYNIVAINMSLGGGAYTSECPEVSYGTAIASAHNAGIAVVVASGNDGFTNAMARPACVPEAFSVGAVYHMNHSGGQYYSLCSDVSTSADKVTCFSNSASFLDVVAPGGRITGAGILMSGTSQATPHVAGAVAVLQAARPLDTLEDLYDRIVHGGKEIVDHRNGLSFRRLDLEASLGDDLCMFAVESESLDVSDASGFVDFDVTTEPGCVWEVGNVEDWVYAVELEYAGSGTVRFQFEVNESIEREATFVVAGHSVTIVQAPHSGPEGINVQINGGAAATGSSRVTVTSYALTGRGLPVEMCLANTELCERWVDYEEEYDWRVDRAQGEKTVSVWLRLADGSLVGGAPGVDTIIYDKGRPDDGTVDAAQGNRQVVLTWSGFTDELTDVTSYRVFYGTRRVSACREGSGRTLIYDGADETFTHGGLVNGIIYYYRVCAVDEVGNESRGEQAQSMPVPEQNPPVGSIEIDGGNPATRSTSVALAINATDAYRVTHMCVYEGSCSRWTTFSRDMTFRPRSTGEVEISVMFRDEWFNESDPVSDTIIVDRRLPQDGVLDAVAADGAIQLSWTGFEDSLTEIESYLVVMNDRTMPSNCTRFEPEYEGDDDGVIINSLINGVTYHFRICAVDQAGNVSRGATGSARPVPVRDDPTPEVGINNGATATNRTNLHISLDVELADEMQFMCLSEFDTCSRWMNFAAESSFTIARGDGLRTVNVWLEDVWGNVSPAPQSDQILMDTVRPIDGLVTVTGGDGTALVSWSGYSDTDSGLAEYVLTYHVRSMRNCGSGEVIYQGTASEFAVDALANGERHYFRLCGLDQAGNLSLGVEVSLVPVEETIPPTAEIEINGGALATSKTLVSVEISATDDSGVTHMCLAGDDGICGRWVSFNSPALVRIPPEIGAHSLHVWLRDQWGNAMTEPTVSQIFYDPNAPIDGTLVLTTDDSEASLSWSGFSDVDTAVDRYIVVVATDREPRVCVPGRTIESVFEGTATEVNVSDLENGQTVFFRVCAIDQAGTHSAGVAVSGTPVPERDAPSGTVSINGGSTATNTVDVDVTVDIVDASEVSHICMSQNDDPCRTWHSYDEVNDFRISATAGTQTVYVWLRDEWGNEMDVPISGSIIFDRIAPSDGDGFSAAANDHVVALTWAEGTDERSGVGEYVVVVRDRRSPSSCTQGDPVYSGSETNILHDGLINGSTYFYRVCVRDRAGNLSLGQVISAKPVPEHDAPTGSFVLAGGADSTNFRVIEVEIDALDESQVAELCFSTTTECSRFFEFEQNTTTRLVSANGEQTVYLWLRDEWGNTSTGPISQTITLDTRRPLDGSVEGVPGVAEGEVTWTGFSDALTGVDHYIVISGSDTPTDCIRETGETVLYEGADTSFTHELLNIGQTYYYRVCAVDEAGNISRGRPLHFTPVPEIDAPVGSFEIAGGAELTGDLSASLAIEATDATGVAQMCISNTDSCTRWRVFDTTYTHRFLSGDGEKTVYLWFRDSLGNTSDTPIVQTIELDRSSPLDGTSELVPGDGQLTISWSDFSDAGSGIANFRLIRASSTPSTCVASGSRVLVYDSDGSSVVDSGLENAQTAYYRLCAVDEAGNTSAGITFSGVPAVPE